LARKPFRFFDRIIVPTTDVALLSRLSMVGVPLLTAVPDYLANIQLWGSVALHALI